MGEIFTNVVIKLGWAAVGGLLGVLFTIGISRHIAKKEQKKIQLEIDKIINQTSKIPVSRTNPNALRIKKELLRFGIDSRDVMYDAHRQRSAFLQLIKLLMKREISKYKNNEDLINEDLAAYLGSRSETIFEYETGQKNLSDPQSVKLIELFDSIITEHKIDATKYYKNRSSSA